MKRYCIDTSGFSNPLVFMPDDIHKSVWLRIMTLIEDDHLAVTTEIYDEMCRLPGSVGECIRAHRSALVLEVEGEGWDWETYVRTASDMQIRYRSFISEWQGDRAGTIGLNDVSIIALAKTLRLPVLSMEKPILNVASRKRTIPNICQEEKIEHLDFNTFLRRESISV